MNLMEANFKMLKINQDKALQAIKSLKGQETIRGYGGEPHFSWVNTEDFMEAQHIKEALRAWRWWVGFNESGDIDNINFEGEKYGDDKVVFGAIAPFVVDGSYIQMLGEDGEMWRWIFNNGELETITGKVTFGE